MPFVSVIISVYNGEKTIQETISSVLNQSFSDFELIVIDDGSTDQTVAIANSFSDSRIKVFSYPNAGQAVSRNRGLDYASGEFIAFLDADDLWKPGKLEAQINALKDHPEAAIAYSWVNYVNEAGKALSPGSRATQNGDIYPYLLLANFIENSSNPLVRKTALDTVGGFDPELLYAEDWDLWLRLAASYSFIVVPSADVLYRVVSGSSSSNVDKTEINSLKVINRAFNQAPDSLQCLKPHSLANLYKYLLYKSLDNTSQQKQNSKAIHFLYQTIRNDGKLMRSPIFLKVILKLIITSILPPKQAQILLQRSPKIASTNTLLNHLQLSPYDIHK